MADTRQLPAPLAIYWDWQLDAACREMATTMFFHPPDDRGPRTRGPDPQRQTVCRTCPSSTNAPRTP